VKRLDRVSGQWFDLSVISHKAQDDLLAGMNVQLLADFLGKNNLSFGGCFYNGHVFYPGKKVLLCV
jgi:hypothetical protein